MHFRENLAILFAIAMQNYIAKTTSTCIVFRTQKTRLDIYIYIILYIFFISNVKIGFVINFPFQWIISMLVFLVD